MRTIGRRRSGFSGSTRRPGGLRGLALDVPLQRLAPTASTALPTQLVSRCWDSRLRRQRDV